MESKKDQNKQTALIIRGKKKNQKQIHNYGEQSGGFQKGEGTGWVASVTGMKTDKLLIINQVGQGDRKYSMVHTV